MAAVNLATGQIEFEDTNFNQHQQMRPMHNTQYGGFRPQMLDVNGTGQTTAL